MQRTERADDLRASYVIIKALLDGKEKYLLQYNESENAYNFIRGDVEDEQGFEMTAIKAIEEMLPPLSHQVDFVIKHLLQKPIWKAIANSAAQKGKHQLQFFQMFFLRPLKDYAYLFRLDSSYRWFTQGELLKGESKQGEIIGAFPLSEIRNDPDCLSVLPNNLMQFYMRQYASQLKQALEEGKEENGTKGEVLIQDVDVDDCDFLVALLRKEILSHVSGWGIAYVKISYESLQPPRAEKGSVTHRYAHIPGVRENVREILTNLQKIRLRLTIESTQKLQIPPYQAMGPAEVSAVDLFSNAPMVELLNPEGRILSLEPGFKISMEIFLQKGKGYLSGVLQKVEDPFRITLDVDFNPVKRVETQTSEKGIRLIIETTGAVTPLEALEELLNPYLRRNENGDNR